MLTTVHNTPFAEWARRVLASGCATMVLALTIFAASPTAHDLLHDTGHATPGGEDACAVVLFAGGVLLVVAVAVPTPPENLFPARLPVAATEVCLVSPRYLRQPERGPPGNRIG
ncbi:MAG: DUF2946 family protein [Opitutaceae bacterium]